MISFLVRTMLAFASFWNAMQPKMSSVAQYIHLCFQARMSHESHEAPHPGLKITLID